MWENRIGLVCLTWGGLFGSGWYIQFLLLHNIDEVMTPSILVVDDYKNVQLMECRESLIRESHEKMWRQDDCLGFHIFTYSYGFFCLFFHDDSIST